jgi:PadR family transcriptional regulator PadR
MAQELSWRNCDMSQQYSHLETEMNRGFLQVLALVALEKSMYGYSMLRLFEKMGYVVEENSLYPLLRRLQKMELIESEWNVSQERPRKFYTITDKGRAIREQLFQIWHRQNDVLKKLIKVSKNV